MPIKKKSEHINQAFEEIKISGITVNPTPEDDELALNRLEDMASEMEEGRNICLNYAFEDVPDPDTSSGVPAKFNHMIATNLAIRLLSAFGKDIPQSLSMQASGSASTASSISAAQLINRVRYPDRQPAGSGVTFRWNRWIRFFREDANPVVSCETERLELSAIGDYTASWSDWLGETETITDYNIINTNGLEITNDQITTDSDGVSFTAKGVKCGAQTVTIEIVTSETTPENADVRTINFNVLDNATRTQA